MSPLRNPAIGLSNPSTLIPGAALNATSGAGGEHTAMTPLRQKSRSKSPGHALNNSLPPGTALMQVRGVQA